MFKAVRDLTFSVFNAHPLRGSWRENIEYKFDALMSLKGASLVFLLIVTSIYVCLGGFLYNVLTWSEAGLLESIFKSWTFVADPGTHAGEEGLGARFASWLITLGGLVSFAILIGIIGDTIQSKVESLKKGKSVVLEEGHILVLGWSTKIFSFLENIALAQESEGGGVVVILSDDSLSPEEKLGLINHHCAKLNQTQVIVRSGSIMSAAHLRKMGALRAKCVVVFADESSKRTSDARALRGHIVVEVVDKECSQLIEMAGEGHVVPLVAHEMIGRLLVQCARQPGLAEVYMNLLSFDDSEFYLSKWPALTGKTFSEVCYWFDGAVVVGYGRENSNGECTVFLNPSETDKIQDGDTIVVIAEDDSTYSVRSEMIDPKQFTSIFKDHRFKTKPKSLAPTNTLFCGWRPNMEEMIAQFDEFANPGSHLTIMCKIEDEKKSITRTLESLRCKNTMVSHFNGDPLSRHELETVFNKQESTFISVVVFSDAEASDSHEQSSLSDSVVLITTLHLQEISKKMCNNELLIISEIGDPNTKNLVSAKGSDWIVSNELVSMALTQMAECRENRNIWEELFVAEGNEIYFNEISQYLMQEDGKEGEAVCFWDLFARGRTRKEIVIGWCYPGEKPIINPVDKTTRIIFPSDVKLAVLAADPHGNMGHL